MSHTLPPNGRVFAKYVRTVLILRLREWNMDLEWELPHSAHNYHLYCTSVYRPPYPSFHYFIPYVNCRPTSHGIETLLIVRKKSVVVHKTYISNFENGVCCVETTEKWSFCCLESTRGHDRHRKEGVSVESCQGSNSS